MIRDIFTEPGYSLYSGQVLEEGKYITICVGGSGNIFMTRDIYKEGKFTSGSNVILYKHEKDVFGSYESFKKKLVFIISDPEKLPPDIEKHDGVEIKKSPDCLEEILILDRTKATQVTEKLVKVLLDKGIIEK